MINSRDIKDLHPKVKAMAERFLAECKEAGLCALVYYLVTHGKM